MKVSNQSLRWRTLLSIFIICLSIFGVAPSQAVFGLGTCEKVKKQILKIEQIVNKEIRYWNWRYSISRPVDSSSLDQPLDTSSRRRLEKFESNQYLNQIWKLSYNNKKCFSPSQNLETDRRTNLGGKSTNYTIINVYVRSPQLYIWKTAALESIYSY